MIVQQTHYRLSCLSYPQTWTVFLRTSFPGPSQINYDHKRNWHETGGEREAIAWSSESQMWVRDTMTIQTLPLTCLTCSHTIGAGPDVPSAADKIPSSSHLLDQGWKWLNSLSLDVPFCPGFYTSHPASSLSSSLPSLAGLRWLQELHQA